MTYFDGRMRKRHLHRMGKLVSKHLMQAVLKIEGRTDKGDRYL